MKSMEQLEKMYEKEIKLSEQHKKNAADIKKQMELQMGKAAVQKITALNMTGTEYDKLMKLLGSGKKTVLEAAGMVLNADMEEKGKKRREETEKEQKTEQMKEVEPHERREEHALQ